MSFDTQQRLQKKQNGIKKRLPASLRKELATDMLVASTCKARGYKYGPGDFVAYTDGEGCCIGRMQVAVIQRLHDEVNGVSVRFDLVLERTTLDNEVKAPFVGVSINVPRVFDYISSSRALCPLSAYLHQRPGDCDRYILFTHRLCVRLHDLHNVPA